MMNATLLTNKVVNEIDRSWWPFVSKRTVRTMISEFMLTRDQYENIITQWRNDYATKLYEWKDALRECDELQKRLDAAKQEIANLEFIISQKDIDVDCNEG